MFLTLSSAARCSSTYLENVKDAHASIQTYVLVARDQLMRYISALSERLPNPLDEVVFGKHSFFFYDMHSTPTHIR